MVLNLKTTLETTVDKIIRILAADIKCYFYLSTGQRCLFIQLF